MDGSLDELVKIRVDGKGKKSRAVDGGQGKFAGM